MLAPDPRVLLLLDCGDRGPPYWWTTSGQLSDHSLFLPCCFWKPRRLNPAMDWTWTFRGETFQRRKIVGCLLFISSPGDRFYWHSGSLLNWDWSIHIAQQARFSGNILPGVLLRFCWLSTFGPCWRKTVLLFVSHALRCAGLTLWVGREERGITNWITLSALEFFFFGLALLGFAFQHWRTSASSNYLALREC